MTKHNFRRFLAEFLGSAALAVVVIGSGIAAQRLSPTDTGLQLLENAIATAGGLFVLIIVFAPISGAHFNPVVSLLDAAFGHRPWRELAFYLPAQIVGCTAGAITANTMFGLPSIQISATDRLTAPNLLSEVIATAGLGVVIFVLARTGRSRHAAAAVACYIGAAYFFTSSTSFANPAITIGRILSDTFAFSDTFAGIAPTAAPGFIAAQLLGGVVAFVIVRLLVPRPLSLTSSDASSPVQSPSPRYPGVNRPRPLSARRART